MLAPKEVKAQESARPTSLTKPGFQEPVSRVVTGSHTPSPAPEAVPPLKPVSLVKIEEPVPGKVKPRPAETIVQSPKQHPEPAKGLSAEDQAFLDFHNQHRSQHQNTLPVQWNPKLAKVASAHAAQCVCLSLSGNSRLTIGIRTSPAK
jgi:uncharacterized protein YkwD